MLPHPPAVGLVDHLEHFGPPPDRGAELIEAVRRAGLRGRGGAGFPTATKMAAVAGRRRPVVVANGTEGEPLSAKDKTLLTFAPHLVLDGVVLAAGAVGARQATLCVERTAAVTIEAVSRALHERSRARLDPVEVELARTPDRYVAGEESALVHWLNGGEAKPTFVPPRPYERGVAGRPTLIANVETLAQMALIARHGPEWWRSVGTAEDPGATLMTVSGAVARPGVYEIPFGIALEALLGAAGAPVPVAGPVLVGGYFGTWIPPARIGQVDLASASLGRAGASFGCGAIAVLPEGSCGLAESARVARWLADQNAGQCGPCMFGLPAIAAAMEAIVAGERSREAERLVGRWTAMVKGRGACKHPDGVARFVESSLRTFAADVVEHRRRGPCPSRPAILPAPEKGGWR
ncbi:MAG TPA: NADH-ubiquinone oxidoreductase-F iron-sulfur binding region domain-containing protein [Acidimicrobiales bacterium]|jgi:NADH:ubiquinone oxidoreductase subunit F (NADH-binding)